MFYLTKEEAAILLHDKSLVSGEINSELQRLKDPNNRVSINFYSGAWLGYDGCGFVIRSWEGEDKKVKELYEYLEIMEDVEEEEDDDYQDMLESYLSDCV